MILQANVWAGYDPTGMWESEKCDGHRAKWTGEHFLSKRGRKIKPPCWFTKDLPKEPLDGELWAGRGNLHLVTAAVIGNRERDWRSVMYAVFDAPEFPGVFEERINRANSIVVPNTHVIVLPFVRCEGKTQLLKRLREVVSQGGEGLTLRKPGSLYVDGYSDTLLKVKLKRDDEGLVIKHISGKRQGLCGSLLVMTKDGKIFKVASGITETMTHNPPPIGTVITYEYDTLTEEGIPRPATFLRIRKDI
jgi:DNA ligase-1